MGSCGYFCEWANKSKARKFVPQQCINQKLESSIFNQNDGKQIIFPKIILHFFFECSTYYLNSSAPFKPLVTREVPLNHLGSQGNHFTLTLKQMETKFVLIIKRCHTRENEIMYFLTL